MNTTAAQHSPYRSPEHKQYFQALYNNPEKLKRYKAFTELNNAYALIRNPQILAAVKRSRKFRTQNTAWRKHGFVAPHRIGMVTTHRKQYAFLDGYEWAREYILGDNSPIGEHGYYNLINEIATTQNLTTKQATVFFQTRAFYETVIGVEGDLAALNLATAHHSKNGHTVREATATEETKFHLDLIVVDAWGDPVCAYQNKPQTFFTSTAHLHGETTDRKGNLGLHKDQINNIKSNMEYTRNTYPHPPVYYLNTAELRNNIFAPLTVQQVEQKTLGQTRITETPTYTTGNPLP